MTKVRRVDLYPDDFIAGTRRLSDAEMGVYVRICLCIYSEGGPVDIDDVKSVCSSHGNTFNSIIQKLQGLGKIAANGRQIIQKRCANELERARNRIGKAEQMAAKRWKNNDTQQPQASDPSTANKQQTTNNKQQEEDSEAIASGVAEPPPDPIKDLWNRGKALLGNTKSAGSLIGKLRQDHGDAVLLQAIVATEAEHASDPAAFLIGCCNRAKANGHAKRLSPGEKLFLGFAQAAEGDFGADSEAPQPLLDRRR